MRAAAVVRAGPLLTVQDRGRPGLAHLGVPPSGAADAASLELGNRLVGNPPGAAGLEATLVGPTLRFDPGALVAVTGADAGARLDGRPLPLGEARQGGLLELGPCTQGVRAYVAVYGGVAVEPVLGSRSHDLLTGLGPPPLRDGDVLPLGQVTDCYKGPRPGAAGPAGAPPAFGAELVTDCYLRVVPGPRDDWFAPAALQALTTAAWRVSPASNRVGTRLEGPALAWARAEELLSEGVVTGALQVPPSGQPILLGPDHPTTGGYPVLAVVVTDDLSRAGQLAPGSAVRFRLA